MCLEKTFAGHGTEAGRAPAVQSQGLNADTVSLFVVLPYVLFYSKMGSDPEESQASDFSFGKKSHIKVFKKCEPSK